MRFVLCAALLAALCAAAENPPPPLLVPAAKGQTAQVKAMLDAGANIEAAGRDGRTALMLAAQHGHLETVRLLLARGAKPDARDREGFTAWALAMFAPAGHGNHDAVLKLLPQPPRWRIAIETGWSPALLASSCFMNRDQLVWQVRSYHLDTLLLNEFARFATSPAAKNLIEIGGTATQGMGGEQRASAPTAGEDALVQFEVQPGAACAGQSDNVTLSIQVRIVRVRDHAAVFEHSFAGGVKGLRVQPVDNPRQYEPVWEAWIKPQGEIIYWAVGSALARSTP